MLKNKGPTVISDGGMRAMPDGAARTGAAKQRRLAECRKAVGLTQEQLAEQLGVDRTTVVRWERGTTRPLPWLWPRLARALRVPVGRLTELLGGSAPAGPDGRGPPVPLVPRQLPAAVAGFTGRAGELQALTRLLEEAGTGAAAAVVISAIGGTAGVGKTALAVHWAHLAAGQFPDGQLYVNLRGFHPDRPMPPGDALAGFLRSLGVGGRDIPADEDERAARYRSLLAGKKVLIVLDNARDERQVRPLLPGSGSCAVVVTSRDSLAGLVAGHGARRLDLDLLPLAEAVGLLRALIGRRVEDDPGAAATLAGQCCRLPLALRVAAELAASRPAAPLAELARELADQQRRLDLLDAGGDPQTAVRAVFSWSYQQLTVEAARMFRLLGLHPGPDITAPAAASLAAVDEPGAGRLLAQLTRAHLLAEHAPGRYALHDLLRAYAADQARDTDSEPERAAATVRVLDHYLHTARDGAVLGMPSFGLIQLAPPSPGTIPEQFTRYDQALAWFEAEYHVLLAAVTLAVDCGLDKYAWQIPWATTDFLATRGHMLEWTATKHTATAAASRDNAAIIASGHRDNLGPLGDYQQIPEFYTSNLKLYRRLGNRRGQALSLLSLANIAEYLGQYAEALSHAEQAAGLFRSIGDKAGEAELLNAVGWYHALLGHYQQARQLCRQALTLNTRYGSRHLEGNIWKSLGYAEYHADHLGEAAACYQRALSSFRAVGDRYSEADALTNLGDIRHAADELLQAREAWQQALAILENMRHPDADNVRAKLASTNDHAFRSPSA
jgi:tetratricopeptide (TPR) repeat protein/DNA-binding XRE family transcriptional regulator